jgi:hypothetical protein
VIASFAGAADAAAFAEWAEPRYTCSAPEDASVDPALSWAVLVVVPDSMCAFDEPGPGAVAEIERGARAFGGRLDRRRLDDPSSGYARMRAAPPPSVVRRYAPRASVDAALPPPGDMEGLF